MLSQSIFDLMFIYVEKLNISDKDYIKTLAKYAIELNFIRKSIIQVLQIYYQFIYKIYD